MTAEMISMNSISELSHVSRAQGREQQSPSGKLNCSSVGIIANTLCLH